ncbi:hypothetical protein DFR50_15215 [Roseiarcus fermentans]|uniref:Uncharacterized protein n=1 Tax=Roseiarcus fermentans TaxID=1473586 RepID=A0A366EJ30_9HYPH|nr:hypothetical protein DFR50_15215 [Roseiarcus fermentans]
MKPLSKYTMARLRNHFEVLLGHRRASEINSGDIETAHSDGRPRTAASRTLGPDRRSAPNWVPV